MSDISDTFKFIKLGKFSIVTVISRTLTRVQYCSNKVLLSPVRSVSVTRRIPIIARSFLSSSVIMSDSEDDNNVPDGATAQKLVKEFENVTNTDEIMAQMYLQVKQVC